MADHKMKHAVHVVNDELVCDNDRGCVLNPVDGRG